MRDLNLIPSSTCSGMLNNICQGPSLLDKSDFFILLWPSAQTSQTSYLQRMWVNVLDGVQVPECFGSSPGDSDESKHRCLGSVPEQLAQNLQGSRPGRSVLWRSSPKLTRMHTKNWELLSSWQAFTPSRGIQWINNLCSMNILIQTSAMPTANLSLAFQFG